MLDFISKIDERPIVELNIRFKEVSNKVYLMDLHGLTSLLAHLTIDILDIQNGNNNSTSTSFGGLSIFGKARVEYCKRALLSEEFIDRERLLRHIDIPIKVTGNKELIEIAESLAESIRVERTFDYGQFVLSKLNVYLFQDISAEYLEKFYPPSQYERIVLMNKVSECIKKSKDFPIQACSAREVLFFLNQFTDALGYYLGFGEALYQGIDFIESQKRYKTQLPVYKRCIEKIIDSGLKQQLRKRKGRKM